MLRYMWYQVLLERAADGSLQFLTNLIISLMKAIDIRSESAVKLLAEFLDLDAPYEAGNHHVNAEHFAHGMS